ncbi:hypothetical protein Tco_0213173 [Tanacetum coccineum]
MRIWVASQMIETRLSGRSTITNGVIVETFRKVREQNPLVDVVPLPFGYLRVPSARGSNFCSLIASGNLAFSINIPPTSSLLTFSGLRASDLESEHYCTKFQIMSCMFFMNLTGVMLKKSLFLCSNTAPKPLFEASQFAMKSSLPSVMQGLGALHNFASNS